MTVIKHEDLPYRPGVGMMVINSAHQVFVARRIDIPIEAWQMPQGGIDEGETPEQAAYRELLEEIGTNNVKIISETAGWYHYDVPEYFLGRFWGGKYRGQKQKWFLMLFEGQDQDINLNTAHPEFCEWKWVDIEDLPRLAISFKQESYRNIIKELGPKIKEM